jgi:hypothetical protein
MPLRTCVVSFTDSRGVVHEAEMQADSLFEAAALGLNAFRRSGLLEEQPGPATRVRVEVREAVVRHVVTLRQLLTWMDSAAVTPADRARRERVRRLLKP